MSYKVPTSSSMRGERPVLCDAICTMHVRVASAPLHPTSTTNIPPPFSARCPHLSCATTWSSRVRTYCGSSGGKRNLVQRDCSAGMILLT